MILVVIALAVAFGLAIRPAIQADRMDQYHLMHGPNDGCRECLDK